MQKFALLLLAVCWKCNAIGQFKKIEGLWINTQYQTIGKTNKELGAHTTPQYIEIDSVGRCIIINDFEHSINVGKIIKTFKYGKVSQYMYKKYLSYYITEMESDDNYLSLEINLNGILLLFKKTSLEKENLVK